MEHNINDRDMHKNAVKQDDNNTLNMLTKNTHVLHFTIFDINLASILIYYTDCDSVYSAGLELTKVTNHLTFCKSMN